MTVNPDQAAAQVDTLWSGSSGFAYLAANVPSSKLKSDWLQWFFRWPEQRDELLAKATEVAPTKDTYMGVVLHSAKNGKEASALPGYWLWADLDDAIDQAKLDPLGAMVVESGSSGHAHVYVRLAEELSPPDLKTWNRRLTKWLGADPSGCDLAQVLRLAGTRNHKADGGSVRMERQATRKWTLEELGSILPPVDVSIEGNGEASELPDFEPLPNPSDKYFWTFFDNVTGEAPNPSAKGPNGEDRSRSGRTHWFEQRCAEIGLEPGQIRTAVHSFLPAKDKESDEAGWIDHDFRYWLRDEWPKFKDAKFKQDVEERAYTLRVNDAAKAIVTDEQETAAFDPPTTVALTLKEDLADAGGDDRSFTT